MRYAMEMAFTDTYRRYQHEHPALREAMCLRAQFPAILRPLQEGDRFAGRVAYGMVGFSPQEGPETFGYFIKTWPLNRALEKGELTTEEEAAARELLAFWEQEHSAAKTRAAYPADLQAAFPTNNWSGEPGIAFPLFRLAGGYLDFDKLVRLGIPGLKEALSGDSTLHRAMRDALDLLSEVCLWYANQAPAPVAAVLRRISAHRPESFREAAQLAWLYAIIAGVRNYGRMDVYLGDFYAADIDSGRMTEAEGLALTQSLWRLMAARRFVFDGRVILGGMGRRNVANADRFALVAMEATRTVLEVEPQLTLRWHKGMNPALMAKALEVIGEGRTFPMLYNDDVNVDAVMKAYNVSREEAVHYVPFGCGEYVLDHRSYGSPNAVINLVKALEAVLHNGRCALTGKQVGLPTGDLAAFDTFDKLLAAYKQQAEHYVALAARTQAIEYQVAGQEAPFLFSSMLYDDCIARDKGLFEGGIRYLGATLETYGNTNTADSLTAIKTLVYDRGVLTLEQVVAALDANFEGHEQVHRLMLNAPKYGNDDSAADAIAREVHEHVCHTVRNQAEPVGLHSHLVVIINNSGNTTVGKLTAASADGRKARESFANANNPAPGMDKKGLTAMLNSLVKLDPSIHAGAVQNLKLSRELFTQRREQLEATLETYFENGGTQAMISVVSRGDLEAAMQEPAKYTHLFVRVGGFSSRFVELEPQVQREIIGRTLY